MPHPNDRRSRISRRDFLRRAAAAGVAMPSAAAILAACGSGAQQTVQGGSSSGNGNASQYGTGGISGAPYPLARPDAPVTWKIQSDNQPIAAGMQPEKNATLQVLRWPYYLDNGVIRRSSSSTTARSPSPSTPIWTRASPRSTPDREHTT